ncbi:MAG: hypothetical protein H8E44_44070 [Planctomycetes bacterium]|nr:hypothetical protein [Planctomycetota bacterium]
MANLRSVFGGIYQQLDQRVTVQRSVAEEAQHRGLQMTVERLALTRARRLWHRTISRGLIDNVNYHPLYG